MKLTLLALAVLPLGAETLSVDEIIRRAVTANLKNESRDRDYAMTRDVLERRLDGSGRVLSTSTRKYEIMWLHGAPFSRLLEREGKPLPPDEERKQQKRVDEAASTAEKRGKERAEDRKRRADAIRALPRAYDFRILRSEDIDGASTWAIQCTRKPGFRPQTEGGEILTKLEGTLWIEKSTFQLIRVQARTVETLSFGWFLARLRPGASIELENKLVAENVWLPQRVLIRYDARLGLIKPIRGETEILMSNFRKFNADSRVLGVRER